MKLFTAFLIIFLPQILFAQNFEINLKIIDPENKIEDNGTCDLAIYNQYSFPGAKHIYNATIYNKQATFKDAIGAAEIAMLSLNIGSRFISYKIVIDPDATYYVTYDVPNSKFNIASNSKSDNLMRLFFNGLDSLYKLKDARIALHKQFIVAKNVKSADSILKLVETFDNDLRNFNKKIAAENPNNIISPYILTKNYHFDLEEQKIYENLSDEIKKTSYGILLKESMDADLKSNKLEEKAQLINEALIPIAGNTTDGSAILLNQQYFKQNNNKVTLIEFWASWCAPCRESLKKLYPFYYLNKSKGFNVILVSLDDDIEKWKQVSLSDNYPWLNISDGKGHLSDTPKNYKINAIPANILIDANGKIIARNVFDLAPIKQILENSN